MSDDSLFTLRELKSIIDERDLRYAQVASEKDKAISAALAAAEKAVTVAEAQNQKWRENANEWRDAMDDRESDFVKADNFQTTIANLTKDIKDLKARIDTEEGKGAGVNQLWIIIVAVISTLGILVMLWTHFNK